MENKNRKEYLDILKGIAIFLVVFGHFEIYGPLKNFIYAFHMPLFMFLSGCTFYYSYNKNRIGDFKTLVRYQVGKAISLLIPYLSIVFIFRLLFNFYNSGLKHFLLIFIEDFKQLQSLWFLPVLFGIEIIYSFGIYIFSKWKNIDEKKNIILETVFVIGISFFCFISYRFVRFEIFRKIAIYLIPFFVGHSLEKYPAIKKICASEMFCTCAIVLCIFLIPHYNLENKWGGVLVLRLIIGCFISLLLYKFFTDQACPYINLMIRHWRQIGKHTLEVYIFHPYFARVFGADFEDVGLSIIYYTISSILVIIACILLGVLISNTSKTFTFLFLGKKIKN